MDLRKALIEANGRDMARFLDWHDAIPLPRKSNTLRNDRRTAEQFLDFNAIMQNRALADGQLDGAVALHNILERHRIAYLADEVGWARHTLPSG